MLQARRQLDLAQKPLTSQRERDLGAQRFQRDEALMFDVAREIDQRHAAAAQLPIDDVMIGERCVQFCKRISHSG